MSEPAPTTKRHTGKLKARNWSKEELNILIEGYEKHQTLLKSKHKDASTNEKKIRLGKQLQIKSIVSVVMEKVGQKNK